jgi:hypothetical protein
VADAGFLLALGLQADLVMGREFGSHRLPYILQSEAPTLQPEMQGRNYVTAVRSSSFPKPPRADNDDDNEKNVGSRRPRNINAVVFMIVVKHRLFGTRTQLVEMNERTQTNAREESEPPWEF